MSDLKINPDRKGWWWLKYTEPAHETSYGWEAPEEYWLAVSPKLRLFDYPGGPARGQLSQIDFDYEYKHWLDEHVSQETFGVSKYLIYLTKQNIEL